MKAFALSWLLFASLAAPVQADAPTLEEQVSGLEERVSSLEANTQQAIFLANCVRAADVVTTKKIDGQWVYVPVPDDYQGRRLYMARIHPSCFEEG